MDINTTDIFSFLGGGFVSTILNRLFLSKKDQNDYALKLITSLQKEVERQGNEMKKLREDYNTLQEEYDVLKEKYSRLTQHD
jgi:predicted  nucleic acid-binding Zn-ribbon protein